MKILFLIRDLEFRGAAKQLSVLAPALPRLRFESRVGMMTGNGPFGGSLRTTGVTVQALGWNRLVDLRPFWQLRKLLREFRPDLIHCWDVPALRALTMVGHGTRHRVIVNLPYAGQYFRSLKDFGSITLLDQWLLRKADRLVVQSRAEHEFWQARGVAALAEVPPGVAPFRNPGEERNETCRALGLPTNARWLLCVGPLEMHKGFKDAIWAFNILGYLYPDLHLLLVGEGTDQARLERFAPTYFPDRVLMVPARADIRGLLAHAEAVWIPSHRLGGINVALEAMAAGRPVVASLLPTLAEVVVDGETGFLLPPGDKVGFARQTRLLLENVDLHRRLGEAGRRRVESRHSVSQLAQRFAELYESVVGDRYLATFSPDFSFGKRVG